MRVVFLGNHTVGVKVLKTISKTEEIVGVVAHPPDPEDGVRYLSVYEFAKKNGWNVIRLSGKDPMLELFIRNAKPDLLWVTDYRYILPASILSIPRLGAVNLHPSLLPKYRGRAPINWAILNGERILGLTAHFMDEGIDTGDIIEQISFELKEEQDIGDALQILYPLYEKITQRVLEYFHSGQVPRIPQDHSQATTFPARKPEDGLINWRKPAKSILNLIRAVSKPYPGAFTTVSGHKMIIWKARQSTLSIPSSTPGLVLDNITPNTVHVMCGDGVLLLTDIEFENQKDKLILRPGIILGT